MESFFTVSQYDYHYLLGLLTEPEVQALLREDVRRSGEKVEVCLKEFGVTVLMDSMEDMLQELRFNHRDSPHLGERLERLYDQIYEQTTRQIR